MSIARGLLAELPTPEALLEALRALVDRGYTRLETYTPYPVRGVAELLPLRPSPVTRWALAAGLTGAGGAYFLQWWMNAHDYPIDVGGRPPHSALAFVPITFEMGVLFAGLAALAVVFVLARLTDLHHPLHDVAGFERATIDRFFVAIDAADPRLDRGRTADELAALGAERVTWVGP